MLHALLEICASCELRTIQQMDQTHHGMDTSWKSRSRPASKFLGRAVGSFRANYGVGKVDGPCKNRTAVGRIVLLPSCVCSAMMSEFMTSSSCSFDKASVAMSLAVLTVCLRPRGAAYRLAGLTHSKAKRLVCGGRPGAIQRRCGALDLPRAHVLCGASGGPV